jgi:hypothetical protein
MFYGYDSLSQAVPYSAAGLSEALARVLTNPGRLINETLAPGVTPRSASFQYDQLVVAAHSLGAVVLRRALLDLARRTSYLPALARTRFVLFAPAHMGGDIIRLSVLALQSFSLPFVEAVAKFRCPPLKDLEPGSQTLAQLEAHTTAALASASAGGEATTHLIAECVVHAEHDRIVSKNQFCADPPLTPLPGRDHTTVCKPKAGRMEPLNLLLPFL